MWKRWRSSFSTDATYNLYRRTAATEVSRQCYESVLKFINAVREGLSNNPEKLHEFRSVAKSITSRLKITDDGTPLQYPPDDAPDRLKAVLRGHTDLIELFESIELIEKEDEFQKALAFINDVRQHLSLSTTYRFFLNSFQSYTLGEIHLDKLADVVADIIGDRPALFDQWRYYLDAGRGRSLKRKRCEPPINHDPEPPMDINPSYKVRRIILGKARNGMPIKTGVLNRVCVLKSPDKDTCFRTRNLGRNEKEKFSWEDERFETEMLKERLVAATKYVEARMKDQEYGDETGRRHLFRAINYLYGDEEFEVQELYETFPNQVLPTLIQRINEKLQELQLHIHDHIDVGMRKTFRK